MSELSVLIDQLCPSGVEYKTLGEVASINRGVRVVRAQLADDGQYPVYQNSIKPLGFHTECNCRANRTFLIGAGAAGEVGYSPVEFWAADDCYYIQCSEDLNDRFIFYCVFAKQSFLQSKVRKASVPRLARSFVESLVIPVPPLPVQREIVRRLDAMTGLIEDLEKELAARQKQYEWVREETFKQLEAEGVERKKLGETVEIIRGDRITKRQISDVGDYPVISGGTTPMGYYSRYNRDADSITIAQYGTAGFVDWQTKRFWANDVCYCLKLGENVDGRFLFFSLKQMQDQIFRLRTNAIPACLPRERLAGVEVFLPSVPVQQQIVRRLDEMTELIAAIEKEIALRKQQYEYCRERLLTFKRAG